MHERVRAYESDAYLTELATRVTGSGEEDGRPFVILEDTVLYPEGGGQPCDYGTIEGVGVDDVRKVDGAVRHYLETPVAEAEVRVLLDWRRRYDHMQQHTAQHLLSALFLERHGWPTTSFHLGERSCDIELDTAGVEAEVLTGIEDEFMEKVRAGLPVTTRRVSEEEYRAMGVRGRGLPAGHRGSVRLVEIEGVDRTTCGGTHLRSTAEIESIHLGPIESMRGGSRLYWIAGGRVRRRLGELESMVAGMRTLLETSEEELIATAGARLDALKETTRELRHQTGKLAEVHAGALAASPGRLVEAHFDGADGAFLAGVGRALLELSDTKVGLLTASEGGAHLFFIVAGEQSGVPIDEVGAEVAAALGGRGGGSGKTFQGKAGSLEQRAEAVDVLRRLLGD